MNWTPALLLAFECHIFPLHPSFAYLLLMATCLPLVLGRDVMIDLLPREVLSSFLIFLSKDFEATQNMHGSEPRSCEASSCDVMQFQSLPWGNPCIDSSCPKCMEHFCFKWHTAAAQLERELIAKGWGCV